MSRKDDLDPMVRAYLEIALGFLQIYQFEKTILEASKALRIDNSCQQAYEIIRRAVRKEDTLNVLVAEARQQERKGNFERAYEEWGQILEFFPLHEDIQEWRENAREKAGIPAPKEVSPKEEPEENQVTSKEPGEEEAGDTDTRNLTELLSETRRLKLNREALKRGEILIEEEEEEQFEEEQTEEELAEKYFLKKEEIEKEQSLSSKRELSPSSRSRRDPFADKIEEATGLLYEAQFPEAEQIVQRILESHPSHKGALEILKQSKETQFILNSLLERIKEHEIAGSPRRVLQEWEKVLEILPGNKKVLKKIEKLKRKTDQQLEDMVEKARKLWDKKRLRQVLLECQKVLKINPNHPYCLYLLEKTKETIREAESLVRNAQICQEAQEWQKTEELANLALKLDPKKSEAIELLENARQHLKKTRKMNANDIWEAGVKDLAPQEEQPIKTPETISPSETEEKNPGSLPENSLEPPFFSLPESPKEQIRAEEEEEEEDDDDETVADIFVSALQKAKKRKKTTRRKVIDLPEESDISPLEKELTSFFEEKQALLDQTPQRPSPPKEDMDSDWKKPTTNHSEEPSEWRKKMPSPPERKEPSSKKTPPPSKKEGEGDSIIDWD